MEGEAKSWQKADVVEEVMKKLAYPNLIYGSQVELNWVPVPLLTAWTHWQATSATSSALQLLANLKAIVALAVTFRG